MAHDHKGALRLRLHAILGSKKFDQVMAVNVKGPFLGLKASIPVLSDRGGGSFIITSSIAGLSGAAQIGAYATSKHAVIGLMKSAAKECRRQARHV